jgi:predicted transglutaminase-like cysteine proteinase
MSFSQAGVWRARLRGAVVVLGLALCSVAVRPAGAADRSMVTGALTAQPLGHYDFCKINPRECSIRSRNTAPQHMTANLRRRITSVNVAVNRRIKPMTDQEIYGREEVWAYPDKGVGDCEDYVLEKRRMLIRSGLPVSSLLITVVRKPDGEGHAVLTVRTDMGDFILDNLSDRVRLWTETGYRYLKRQAVDHTGQWVSILDSGAALVGSVR